MCENCKDLRMVHSHCHSDASRIDGLGPVGRLVGAAADKGMDRMALTDHGTLSNAIAFTAAAKARGVKPVMGMEAYVAMDGETFHLTLLADGNVGMNTLIELNNAGARGEYHKPAFPIDLFRRHNAGLTVLTGCPASPMQATEWGDARKVGLELKGIFGDRLFAEFMFVSHGSPWERSAKLARDLKLHPILTNDVHFAMREDAQVHEVLVRLKAAFSYESSQLYLTDAHDIMTRVRDTAPGFIEIAQKGIRNAYRLLGKLEAPSWSGVPRLPHVDNAETAVLKKAGDKLEAYLLANPHLDAAHYRERFVFEYNVVLEMGFCTYFYILEDLVSYARSVNVRVGPGRGSGAGSLLLFALGITEVDPIIHGLQFERFLNPKRKEMPDVDVDFDSVGRELVIRYASERWKGMPVATYARYSEKVLIADLARYYRVPRALSQEASDGGPASDAFDRIAKLNPIFRPAFDAMLGQIRHIGQHAGGIIITDVPVPLERTSHEGLVAAWTEGLESRELTSAGVVKYDLLGISALEVLKRLEQKHGRRAEAPVDDAPEFKLFQDGDTVGIFQFSGSDGIVDFTKRVHPTRFADLVAINALYRPGALDSGAANHYPEWRLKPRKLHPLIDDILAETYGVICYQEQFMAIYAKMTKGDLGDADLARKVIVKSKPGDLVWETKMAELRAKFFRGAVDQGVSKDVVNTIWSEIITHARYSFNKSHAVAYTMLSWEMMWWKAHYPADFYAATLTTDPEKAQRYLFDVVGRGIEVVPPHVNHSSRDYESDGTRVYLPLSAIKGLGETGVDAILSARPFESLEDFMGRVPKRAVNARARQGLNQLNAFKDVPGNPASLLLKPPEPMTVAEQQIAYLGFMLPTPRIMKAIRKAEKQGMMAGIIESREERESKWGKYMVYRLLPQGTCWSRNIPDRMPGDIVKIKLKRDSGKILQILPLFD
jgi:DNA polymerase-3 subunit alpha